MQHRTGKTRAAETAPDGEAPPWKTMAAEDGGGGGDREAGGVLSQALSRQSGRSASGSFRKMPRQVFWETVRRMTQGDRCIPGRRQRPDRTGVQANLDRGERGLGLLRR